MLGYTSSTLVKMVLKSFMVAKSHKMCHLSPEKAQDLVILSHDIRRETASSKYAEFWGFQRVVDISAWLCCLRRSDSEVVDNFGEKPMSCVGKWTDMF